MRQRKEEMPRLAAELQAKFAAVREAGAGHQSKHGKPEPETRQESGTHKSGNRDGLAGTLRSCRRQVRGDPSA